jgi:hypothetical protein
MNNQTIWIRGNGLTIPVDLSGAKMFLLPIEDEEGIGAEEGVPRPIKWKQVSELSEGAHIFVGGRAISRAGRPRFESSKDEPLLVILYDGSERSLLMRAVRAGRQKNEYWNTLTPYSIAIGVFSQLLMALSFVNRPAFSAAFSAALTGAFGPLLALLPPGVLLTVLSRSFWRRGRMYRALRDLARLPLRHLPSGTTETILPDGSTYGVIRLDDEKFTALPSRMPRLPPETANTSSREGWYCYGTQGKDGLVSEPTDPSAVYAAVPDDPERLARRYSIEARIMELGATASLTGGLLLNAAITYSLIAFVRTTL